MVLNSAFDLGCVLDGANLVRVFSAPPPVAFSQAILYVWYGWAAIAVWVISATDIRHVDYFLLSPGKPFTVNEAESAIQADYRIRSKV